MRAARTEPERGVDSERAYPGSGDAKRRNQAIVLLSLTFLSNSFITVYYLVLVELTQPSVAYVVLGLLWSAWVAVLLFEIAGRKGTRARRTTATIAGLCVAVASAAFYVIK